MLYKGCRFTAKAQVVEARHVAIDDSVWVMKASVHGALRERPEL